MKAPFPSNERDRVAALHRYRILDTPPEAAYDRITRLASHLLSTPMALVSLVDNDRQWFKSACGLDATETDRDVAFCGFTILSDSVLCVPNALEDERFFDNGLVLDGPQIRFYAGAPLRTPQGLAVGTLCVLDRQPRAKLTVHEESLLQDLAALVVDELELRFLATSLAKANETLSRLAALDSLTGLPNRRCFEEALQEHLDAKSPDSYAVLYMDLDRFKAVNDTGTHAAGDALLQVVAGRLGSAMPGGALLARIGGDEFAALLPRTDCAGAEAVASSLCAELEAPVTIGTHEFRVGVSIGVAMGPSQGTEGGELLRQADQAMYHSKHSGGSCYHMACFEGVGAGVGRPA